MGHRTVVISKGAGGSLKFVVTVDGQTSSAPTIGYGAPLVRNVSGAGADYAASTRGGERVQLHGINFGPPAIAAK